MIYFITIIYSYFVTNRIRNISVAALIFLLLPLTIFAAFRGLSGKDTYLYILRFYHQEFSFGLDSELFFYFIIEAARFFSDDHRVFFALHALILVVLYAVISRNKSNIFFISTIGPVFLLDGITNGMRISIAYFLIIAFKSFFSALLAFFTHISSLFIILFRVIAINKYYLILSVILIIPILFYFQSYLELLSTYAPRVFSKVDKYTDNVLGTFYSGIVDLVVIFVMLLGVFMKTKIKIHHVLFALLICIILYLLVQYSLAFIRINKLIIIALCVVFPLQLSKIKSPIMLGLFIFYTANFMRQLIMDNSFLPWGYGELF